MKKKSSQECGVAGKGRTFCSEGIRVVPLVDTCQKFNEGNNLLSEIPKEITLCKRHHQELTEKGILKFFKIYDLSVSEEWEEDLIHDRHMTYLDPEILEGVANAQKSREMSGGYGCVPGYENLRHANIVLEELALTDKQLMAVCMVFYGGVKKKHAARAMKISSQALSDHIKAALKKIKNNMEGW